MIDFNSLPMNGASGLRSIASNDYGIASVKAFKKAELVAMLEGIEARREAAQAAKDAADAKMVPTSPKVAEAIAKSAKNIKKVAKARRTSRHCNLGDCTRRVSPDSPGSDLCTEHLTEGEWENTHGDNGHDEIAAYDSADKGEGAKAPFDDAHMAIERKIMDACWICNPALNQAGATYVRRAGTSRLGMTMSVPVRAAGEVKAATTLGRLEAASLNGEVKTSSKRGVVTLTIPMTNGTMTLTWAITGAYSYDESAMKVGGKETKLRNVKAALKALGITI